MCCWNIMSWHSKKSREDFRYKLLPDIKTFKKISSTDNRLIFNLNKHFFVKFLESQFLARNLNIYPRDLK